MTPSDPSLAHLLGRLGLVEARVRGAVARRRADDPAPDDPFRGLYLTDEHVERILAGPPPPAAAGAGEEARLAAVEGAADAAEAAGHDLRLRRLARAFGLDGLDLDLLVVAVAPDLDARFERLYGYLNDDVTLRRATVGLALELAAASPLSAPLRARLAPGAPLVAPALVVVEDGERPVLSRGLRVADRVTAHLLGDDRPDPSLAPLLAQPPPPLPGSGAEVARALAAGGRLAYLRDRAGGAARAGAVDALADAGLGAVVVDLDRLAAGDDVAALATVAGREAGLAGAGLVVGPIEALVARGPEAVRVFAELAAPVVLSGRLTWDPAWSRQVPVLADAPVPSPAARAGLWRAAANGGAAATEAAGVTAQFLLAPESVARSMRAAELLAAAAGEPVGPRHVLAGARSQNTGGLERLARRIVPAVGWHDLVLGPDVMAQLRELTARARTRETVLDEWGMRPGGGRGRGVTALFAGDPGTGKTMAAEVVAAALGLDLYAVNLATVVDKYIGETEKNLERIFSEAEGVNGVILFDEADALFGKRSEVGDAHDRHANVEVAYLLQRMESFDGLAVLATNLRANLDEAFARRLDVIVDFPLPDAAQRRALWDRCLGPPLPRGGDLDLDFCARAFELSGGNIRSIAVTAAFLAADAGRPVGMADLRRAVEGEYRKLGRLIVEAEFGHWYAEARVGRGG